MPGWGDIMGEIQSSAPPGRGPDFDGVRAKYIAALHELTQRPVFVYSTAFLSPQSGVGGDLVQINLEDIQAFMEVCHGVPGPSLDLILHSPGGSADAAASIVRYLRDRFKDIRVIVPLAAMSAATMITLSANRIIMGAHSQLGPIDPQMPTPQGYMPARAILDQFERAQQEVSADPARLGAWAPILQHYGPALLQFSANAEELSRRLVAEWLEAYMFDGVDGGAAKAELIAAFFADHNRHKSHGLGIGRDEVRRQGVVVDDLETQREVQDAVLSVFHATTQTMQATGAVKIVENHLGHRFVRSVQVGFTPAQGPPLRP